jgi:hypothetical protein
MARGFVDRYSCRNVLAAEGLLRQLTVGFSDPPTVEVNIDLRSLVVGLLWLLAVRVSDPPFVEVSIDLWSLAVG